MLSVQNMTPEQEYDIQKYAYCFSTRREDFISTITDTLVDNIVFCQQVAEAEKKQSLITNIINGCSIAATNIGKTLTSGVSGAATGSLIGLISGAGMNQLALVCGIGCLFASEMQITTELEKEKKDSKRLLKASQHFLELINDIESPTEVSVRERMHEIAQRLAIKFSIAIYFLDDTADGVYRLADFFTIALMEKITKEGLSLPGTVSKETIIRRAIQFAIPREGHEIYAQFANRVSWVTRLNPARLSGKCLREDKNAFKFFKSLSQAALKEYVKKNNRLSMLYHHFVYDFLQYSPNSLFLTREMTIEGLLCRSPALVLSAQGDLYERRNAPTKPYLRKYPPRYLFSYEDRPLGLQPYYPPFSCFGIDNRARLEGNENIEWIVSNLIIAPILKEKEIYKRIEENFQLPWFLNNAEPQRRDNDDHNSTRQILLQSKIQTQETKATFEFIRPSYDAGLDKLIEELEKLENNTVNSHLLPLNFFVIVILLLDFNKFMPMLSRFLNDCVSTLAHGKMCYPDIQLYSVLIMFIHILIDLCYIAILPSAALSTRLALEKRDKILSIFNAALGVAILLSVKEINLYYSIAMCALICVKLWFQNEIWCQIYEKSMLYTQLVLSLGEAEELKTEDTFSLPKFESDLDSSRVSLGNIINQVREREGFSAQNNIQKRASLFKNSM